MNGVRVSIGVPGADAGLLLEAGELAERWNLATIWAGEPGINEQHNDAYVLTVLSGVAARTHHIRLGAFLRLDEGTHPVRTAEDIGVLDNLSGGRLEVAFVPPAPRDASWEECMIASLTAWSDWRLDDGRSVAVTPVPTQPWMPRLVVNDAHLAERVSGGLLHRADQQTVGAGNGGGVPRRLAVTVELAGGVHSWLARDAVAAVTSLRDTAVRWSAHELIVLLEGRDASELTEDTEALGTVIAMSLRASSEEAAVIIENGRRWLTQERDIHHDPGALS